MLERLEHDWNEADSDRRQATFTTLPSGMYTFRVQGAASGARRSRAGIHSRLVNLWRLGRDRRTVRDAPNKIGGLAPLFDRPTKSPRKQNLWHQSSRVILLASAGSFYGSDKNGTAHLRNGRPVSQFGRLSFFKNAAYRGSLCRFFSWGCTFVMSRLGSCSA